MESVDIAVLLTVVGSIICFGGATVLALGWAFRNGQFDNFQRGALSIFDADEPVGEPTDFFPDHHATTPSQDQPHHTTREK
jgi:cbb3-type cytochrome oxidase maturation protein